MNAPGLRGDPEQKSRSAVDILKRQAEFGAGEFGVDRLVRIGAGFPDRKSLRLRMQYPAIWHSVFDQISLTKFLSGRGN
jgi:hypothetical protein